MPRIHFQLQLTELKDKMLAMAALSQQATIDFPEQVVDCFSGQIHGKVGAPSVACRRRNRAG